ncbi:MAG: choice-of-anchor D domain-containing protein, partial [Planctomycetes bacterium]|nr:choice-of-anchor D domain-containing protein [Planctomycetota bacterium]
MKKTNTYVIIFISIVVFSMLSCSNTSATLKITPKTLDFGNVNLSESSTLILTLTNKYSKDILITNINLSNLTNYVILSGAITPINMSKNASHEISIKFEPTSGGVHFAQLTIMLDASSKPKIVEITGVGVPIAKIVLSDQSIDFSSVLISSDKIVNITVENTGTAELIIDSLQFSGTGAAAFSISSGGSVPIAIQPGLSKDISIKFTPPAQQNYLAELHISHNGLNENTPFTVSLAGEGVITAPRIALDKSSPWDFGSIGIGMSSIQNLEITNNGTDPLTVDSATMSTNTEFKVAGVEDSNGNPITLPEAVAIGA